MYMYFWALYSALLVYVSVFSLLFFKIYLVTMTKWWASLVAQLVKNLPAMQETPVQFLGQEDPLEKEMANHPGMGFPDTSVGKESAWNAGDPGLIPGSGRSAREGIGYPLQYSWASLVAPACNAGDLGSIPGLERRERLPTPVFWPGEFWSGECHGLYSPWGCKE